MENNEYEMNQEFIPTDLLIIEAKPSQLSEQDLSRLIYAAWYSVEEIRIGECVAVSESDLAGFESLNGFVDLVDRGYSNKAEIKLVDTQNKKWSNYHELYFSPGYFPGNAR